MGRNGVNSACRTQGISYGGSGLEVGIEERLRVCLSGHRNIADI